MNRHARETNTTMGGLHSHPLAACLAAILASFGGASAHAPANVESAAAQASGLGQFRARAAGSDYAYRTRPARASLPFRPSGTTLPVTSCADDGGAGTLRGVVAGAASGDTVDLSALTCSTITLAQGAIQSTVEDLAIQGPGQSLLTVDGADADRVFVHTGSGTLAIADLAVSHGYLSGDYNGGCVRSYGSIEMTRSRVSDCVVAAISYAAGGGVAARANVTLIDSTISGNTVTTANNYYGYLYGGGVNAVGELAVTRSTISGNQITFTGAYSPYSIGYGGGVNARADATITASTIEGNSSASFGGGLFIVGHDHAFSRLEIVESTISGNAAGSAGGGVSVGGLFRTYLGSVVLRSDTIARNTAAGNGGGLHFRDYVLVDTQSTIVASNTAAAQADLNADESLAIYGADNLIMEATDAVALPADTLRDDPLLLDLADNGGPTRTHALAAGSPAIDAGNNYFDLDSDQRGAGYARVVGGRADIGAYESGQDATPDLIFADGFDTAQP
jgi:hypothetical protein